jgi:hypothetical protein
MTRYYKKAQLKAMAMMLIKAVMYGDGVELLIR